jgi:hypothetical protein
VLREALLRRFGRLPTYAQGMSSRRSAFLPATFFLSMTSGRSSIT